MKKGYVFDNLSNIECCIPGCFRKLKQRITLNKPTAHTCYKHYKALRNKGQNRKNARIGVYVHGGLQHK